MTDKVQPKPLMYYTDTELIEEAKGLYDAIDNYDCYRISDLIRYQAICDILTEKGYKIEEVKTIEIEKKED
jgi:hypothetical protein